MCYRHVVPFQLTSIVGLHRLPPNITGTISPQKIRSTNMRSLRLLTWLLLASLSAFAQSDRGTITGTVSDPTGAVIPGVGILATNVETAARYETATTETGNYTLPQLPSGTYQLSAELPGFKKYVRQGITVLVAQTLRLDVTLEVGSNNESVTVTENAPLLRTDSSELAHNVNAEFLNNVPILGIGRLASGAAGIRSAYSVASVVPGATWLPDQTMRVNGMEGNTSAMRVDGQDATATISNGQITQTQQSVEAIQEVAVQTSNFAAEFGQSGSVVQCDDEVGNECVPWQCLRLFRQRSAQCRL